MKRIIRLTETDLHRIIRRGVQDTLRENRINRLIGESIRRVLRESEKDDEDLTELEKRVKEAAKKMKELKGKKGMQKEFAEAAVEWRKLKDELDRKKGSFKELVNPSAEEIEKLNKEKGVDKNKRRHPWNKKKEAIKIQDELNVAQRKLKKNDVDAILGL